ncbi:DUF5615 family PIN-like protein [Cyanobium sp. WAJ14-Wanaka]|uniref:DUF5615 family PIN-like protein n=1 Tax=Cyanobium sp. WAJ14-Wanaka TaxID=2823725 RepID=UPI0020CC9CC7|nr:DUF5615 family PIN-like protein [Cyanobium sp. WAJ14-Wanaka]MCP9774947.1 DUF5615 family PIN-like protein [Cyanobium sp. WAJ14-Wanaka]
MNSLPAEGCDTLHTLDLPDGNRTPDALISTLADQQQRVVFSKDTDFIQSHLLQGTPRQLLVIAKGNIRNAELSALVLNALPLLKNLFAAHQLVELHRSAIIIRQ